MDNRIAWQARVDAIRRLTDTAERRSAICALRDESTPSVLADPDLACALLTLVRDELGWAAVLELADTIPRTTFDASPTLEEQRLLAVAKSDDILAAATGFEALVARHGPTPERLGLLGGRYKQLWLAAKRARVQRGETAADADEAHWLDQSIARYEAGMQLDLNEYYCASNLPRLLRSRGAEGDDTRAAAIATLVVEQCQRLVKQDSRDPWLRPTLLIAALAGGNAHDARALLAQVRAEGPAAWQVETVLTDIDTDLELMTDADTRREMRAVRDELATLAS